AGDVHLDAQVRWRIDAEVDLALAADARLVRDPEALIGLQTATALPPSEGGRPTAQDGQAQFLSQDDDETSQEAGTPVVMQGRAHDLESPPVVSQTDSRPLGEGVQEAGVGPPIDVIEDQTLCLRQTNTRHDALRGDGIDRSGEHIDGNLG